jgi:hypothetical protein
LAVGLRAAINNRQANQVNQKKKPPEGGSQFKPDGSGSAYFNNLDFALSARNPNRNFSKCRSFCRSQRIVPG